MRAPLAILTLGFAAGIGSAWWLKPPVAALALLAGAAGGLGCRGRRRAAPANVCLLALAFLAGAGRAAVDGRVPVDSVQRLLGSGAGPVTCEGVLTQDDTWIPHAGGGRAQRRGWLEIDRVRRSDSWVPASGRVQFRLPARAGPVRVGDALRLHGLLRPPRGPAADEPRGFDERRWLWGQGACGVLSVSEPESLAVLPEPPRPWLRYLRWTAELRWRLQEVGRSLLGPEEAGFLEAFLLGEGRGIPAEAKEDFRRTGTIHILVVSGFQVGLVGAIALVALSLARVARGARYLLTGLALILYCALTGAAPPILRATVMGLALCLGQYQGREVSPLNLLGAAALAILAFDPRALADVGFQLSFAAVLGILLGTGWCQVRGYVAQAVAASVGAWAAVTPLVAWHLRTVSFTAPAANLVAVPLGSALVADGLLLYAVGSFWPAGAEPFAAGFAFLARAAAALASWAAALPGGSFRW
ncbi:MAG: ComEC/Rec2 family competence protein [Candidatus Omnitrophica bacterium]|nr:ComEC/Rec2 family competence protein [Candidatus Omnitrophota bacterium]